MRRLRSALATASTSPWRRAPFLLLRRPGVLATVAGATAVLVAAVAAVPIFLSSVGTASVDLQAAERCPRDTGVAQIQPHSADEIRAASPDPFRPLADRLGPSNWWARIQLISMANASDPSGFTQAALVSRDDASTHVEVLEGDRTLDGGIWITDRAAEATGLGVGDRATIGDVDVPVTGVYRDLSGNFVDPFWCSHADLLLIEVVNGDLRRPPPVVLADRATFATLLEGLDLDAAATGWEAPLRPELTVADTAALTTELACHGPRRASLSWCEDGGQPGVPRRQGGLSRTPVQANDDADFVTRYFRSALPFVTKRSEAIQTSVGSGIWPVATFAALAGAGLVAASATLWADRRRRELVLLTVRGVSPAGLGLKAVLELSSALVAGAVAGVALAFGAVVWLGPSSVVEGSALRDAALGAALATTGAAAVIGAVVAVRVGGHGTRRPLRLPLALVPWELGLVWATVVSYRRLGDWGVPVGRGAGVTRVDLWGLLFPVLFLVTAVALTSRLLSLGLAPVKAVSGRWPAALFLAIRRVARHRAAALGLVAASAVAAGVLGYSVTMNRSLDATLEAKSATFVGSDVAVRIPEDDRLPAELAPSSTEVRFHEDAWIEAGDGRETVAVRFVDPDTFGRAAYWDATFSSVPLDEVLDRLARPPADGRVPAVLVGVEGTGAPRLGIESGRTTELALQPIADVEAFPGMSRPRPTVFLSADVIAANALDIRRTELWVDGDRDAILAALRDAGVEFDEVRSVVEVADRSSFVTISWTFGFMQSLGVAAGVLVVGGLAVHLDARRRERLLGHVFLRRMGLTRGQHRRSLVVELAASVLVGCWVGLAIAATAAWLAHGRIDPVPGFRPEPLLRPATAVMVGLGLGAVVLCALAAVVAQRRMDADDAVEVLRAGV